jgi:hypothetical protein
LLTSAVAYEAGAVAREGQKHTAAIAEEAKERSSSPIGPAFVLAGTLPSPLAVAANLGALYDLDYNTKRFLPLSLVTDQMVNRMQSEQAGRQVFDNLMKLRKEVEGWRGKSKEAIAEELAKAIKDYGLTQGLMEKPRDRYEIEDDPAIVPLLEAIVGSKKKESFKLARIADRVFNDSLLYTPPQDLLGFEELVLFWKTEDVPARAYSSYAEAPADIKERVQEAWRLQRARALAMQATEQAQAEARKLKDADAAVRFLKDESQKHDWGPVFELENISRLVPQKVARAGMPQMYEPYQVPDEKINARPDFAEQLLRWLKEAGDVAVVWNQPETVYYVAVLVRREPEGQLERKFLEVYRKAPEDDALLQAFQGERSRDYLKAVMDQLRAEAGPVNEQGQWVVDAEVRKRLDGQGRDSGDTGG